MKRKLLLPLIAIVLLAGCAIKAPTVQIYKEVSVPQEGGLIFNQILNNPENLERGWINRDQTNQHLYWYAQKMFRLSPDGSEIYFYQTKEDNTNIFVKSLANISSSVQQITFRNTKKVSSFDVTADNKSIFFSDNVDGDLNINKKDKIGSAVQLITSSSSSEGMPVISKSGTHVFFTKDENIWSYEIKTGNLTQYAKGFCPEPIDDERFLITRQNEKTANYEIYIINIVNGTETLLLSDPNISFSSAALSPDGKRIAVVGSTKGSKNTNSNLDIYTLNIDGSGLTQITFHPAHDYSPNWSKDGKAIYFISNRGNAKGYYNIWSTNVK